jgi:hypothetical protein
MYSSTLLYEQYSEIFINLVIIYETVNKNTVKLVMFENLLGSTTRKHTTFTTQGPNLKKSVKGGYTTYLNEKSKFY